MSVLLPSPDLHRFPKTTIAVGDLCYRIFTHKNSDGAVRDPWFFSSSNNGKSGRFDLPSPLGSCYFSNTSYACWREVFRGASLVSRSDMDQKRMLVVMKDESSLAVAQLTHTNASAFGVTLDLFSGDDYSAPQAWAKALNDEGFMGIIALLRSDSSGQAKNIVIFGNAGAFADVDGWTSSVVELVHDEDLLNELEVRGIRVESIPYDIKIDPAPRPF